MKTLLIFPPASDPAHPPLGIAALAAYLRPSGRPVELLDLNLAAYEYLLSPERLASCRARLAGRVAELERLPRLPQANAEEYRLAVENLAAADTLQAEAAGALAAFRDLSTYSETARYRRAAATVRRAMEFVSAAHYPVRWYPRGFTMSYLPTRSTDVLRAAQDRNENLFLPFFESVVPDIAARQPNVIGISINYYCQLIPGITLAALLKRALPGCFIAVGGGLVCFFEPEWAALAPFQGMVDAFIPFEGEKPLSALLAALENGQPVDGLSGVLSFPGGKPRFAPPPPPPVPEELPLPDFEGLPVERYLAPRPILPYLTSRGCYWAKCAFCSHHQLYRGRYRRKRGGQVIRELSALNQHYPEAEFYLVDEAIPLVTAQRIAHWIRNGGPRVGWFGEMRLERGLDEATLAALARGGCSLLMFGLESAVPRVLRHMRKGIEPEHAAAILGACTASGIRTFVMFFTGFPTETRAEAEATVRFIAAHSACIDHVAFTNFILEKHAPIFGDPAAYGIREVKASPADDLKIYADYEVASGLGTREAIAFLDEFKTWPEIRQIIERYLFSRAHLAFLQGREVGAGFPPTDLEYTQLDWSRPDTLFPLRRDGLIPLALPYCLDDLKPPLEGSLPGPDIPRRPTNYVADPEAERIIEVGEDGLALLQACDGSRSLHDILELAGAHNREAVVSFYAQVTEAGFLSWSVRPCASS